MITNNNNNISLSSYKCFHWIFTLSFRFMFVHGTLRRNIEFFKMFIFACSQIKNSFQVQFIRIAFLQRFRARSHGEFQPGLTFIWPAHRAEISLRSHEHFQLGLTISCKCKIARESRHLSLLLKTQSMRMTMFLFQLGLEMNCDYMGFLSPFGRAENFNNNKKKKNARLIGQLKG